MILTPLIELTRCPPEIITPYVPLSLARMAVTRPTLKATRSITSSESRNPAFPYSIWCGIGKSFSDSRILYITCALSCPCSMASSLASSAISGILRSSMSTGSFSFKGSSVIYMNFAVISKMYMTKY